MNPCDNEPIFRLWGLCVNAWFHWYSQLLVVPILFSSIDIVMNLWAILIHSHASPSTYMLLSLCTSHTQHHTRAWINLIICDEPCSRNRFKSTKTASIHSESTMAKGDHESDVDVIAHEDVVAHADKRSLLLLGRTKSHIPSCSLTYLRRLDSWSKPASLSLASAVFTFARSRSTTVVCWDTRCKGCYTSYIVKSLLVRTRLSALYYV